MSLVGLELDSELIPEESLPGEALRKRSQRHPEPQPVGGSGGGEVGTNLVWSGPGLGVEGTVIASDF